MCVLTCICVCILFFVFKKNMISSPWGHRWTLLIDAEDNSTLSLQGETDVHNCSPFTLFRVTSVRTWRLENKVFIRHTVQYVCFLTNKLSCVEQTLAKSDRLYVCCLSSCILHYTTKKKQFKYLNTFTAKCFYHVDSICVAQIVRCAIY